MADQKISALTAATTPLAGTEVLPIVQSGATKKVAVSDLTAGRATSASAFSATRAYANTSDLGFVAEANIPGWNLRASGGGRLSMVTGYIGNDISSLLCATGTSNPATEVMRVTHSTGAVNFISSDVTLQAGNLVIGTAGKGVTTGGSFALGFGTNGSTSQATLNTSGYLLLGTSTANNRITVGGNSSTGRVVPATDNVGYVGDGNYRWQAIYAVNGTIQTSDGRQKNTIEDSNLGLAFVNTLRPVSYKWNVGENIITYNNEGNEIATPRPGVRVHYGFIAQEVQAAIPQGVDFGGFVYDTESDTMSLRYHEFIAPMVKAIQELKNELDSVKAELQALKG